MYGLKACEGLIEKYIQQGGHVVTVEEGTLGLGAYCLLWRWLKNSRHKGNLCKRMDFYTFSKIL